MSSEPGNKIISQLSENEKAQSVCVEVNECPDKSEIDPKDNKTSVIIRIGPGATETVSQQNTETETDSLNSNNPCEKHEDPSVSLTESENTTASVTSEDDDHGVANPAFVEDEEEEKDCSNKKKKGHQRQPSCSPNKDIESISGVLGGSGKPENIIINPPILTSETVTDSKDDKQYSEYFMPTTEIKTQLGDYKKNKKSPSAAKIFCWIMSSLLLAGAIIIAALIGTGIIETDPTKQIKVSRKLLPEGITIEDEEFDVKLLEVTEDDAPNVLTNDPEFFSQIKKDAKYFDGQMRITNVEWNSDLENKDSYRYQQLASIIQSELDNLLNEYYGNFAFSSRVQRFMPGSVIVLFEISASLETGGSDVINSDNILDAVVANLDKEFGYLFGKFTVAPGTVMISEKQSEPAIYLVLEEDTPEIDTLEQQLESYESEIFSKPRLEPITELITRDNTENDIEVVTTVTLAEIINPAVVALTNSATVGSNPTTSLADIDTNNANNSTTTESNTNLNIITTAGMTVESEDSNQLVVDIESRTDIYDQSELSGDTPTEYFETQTSINDNIELEYFRSNVEVDNDAETEDAEEVTTDVNILELNTVQSNIDNS